MQDLDLDDIARRPHRYWNVDGFPELMMGLVWVLWGAVFIVGERLPRNRWYDFYWMAFPAVLALSGGVMAWGTHYLKTRVTFPRTGYVALPEPSRATRLGSAAVALIAAMVLAGTVVKTGQNVPPGQMATPVLGVILSLGLLVASVRQRAPHLLALAGVAVALGIALGTRGTGWQSVNWLFLGLGLAAAAVGAIRLVRFLRKYPPQTLEEA